jgi:hypothetical protein
LLGILLDLEKSSGRELVDAEEMGELVERAFDTRGYWSVYPFFGVLPPEDLAGILRRTIGKLSESARASFLLELFGNFDAPLHEDARDLLVGAFKDSVGKAEEPQYMSWSLQSAAQNENDPATARELIEIFVERWGDGLQFEAARVQCLVNEGRGDEALALLIDMQSRGEPSEDDWEAQSALASAEAAVVRTHRAELVEHLLTEGEQRGELAQARERCEQLVGSSGEPDAVLAFRRVCAERWPNDDAVLEALADELRRRPELLWEHHAVLERRAALGKGDEKPFDELARFWKRLDQPLEVAEWKARSKTAKAERRAREKAEKEAREAAGQDAPAEAEGAAAETTGAAAGLVTVSPIGGASSTTSSGSTSVSSSVSVPAAPIMRAISISSSSSATLTLGGATITLEDGGSAVASDGETPSEKAPPANLGAFRERIDGDDAVVARAVFRRMWRSFPNEDEARYFFWSGGAGFGGWNGVPGQWPGDLPDAAAAVLQPPEPPVVEEAAVEAPSEDGAAATEGDATASDVAVEGADAAAAEADGAVATDVVVDGEAEGEVVVEDGEIATEDDEGEGDEAVDEESEGAEAETKPDGTKRRGGLDDFRVPKEEPQEEPTRTYDVLVCLDVGRDEMWRQLRTRTPEQLDYCGPLFEALAKHARRTLGDEAALDALLARFADDSAGRIELELLLAHLEAGVGAERADVRAVLDRLLSTVGPGDSNKLAAVARLLALAGRTDQCAALLPYCASIAARGASFDPYGGMVMIFGSTTSNPASIDALIEAARGALEGEARHAVIADVLAAFEPLDLSSEFADIWYYDPYGGPQDEWYALAVIDAWKTELDARGAFERCRSIAEGLAAWDGETTPPRNAALAAAQLAARAGEAPLAARLLAVALARHESKFEAGGRIVFFGEPLERISRGALSSRDIDALFPADVSGFADFDAWAIEAVAVLRQLVEEGALDAEQGLQAIGVAASRLVGRSGAQGLDGVLSGIESQVAREPQAMLWILDGVVAAGRTELALAIESAFADARLLRADRVVDAVRRARDARGAVAALELAERFASYTLRAELLDVIDELCVATANTERAAHWAEVRARIGSR